MALLQIRHYPDPVLKKVAAPVTDFDETLRQLAHDMAETMYAAPGVGLAAPQVGENQQVFVYLAVGTAGDTEEPESRLLINPMIEPIAGELVYDWEGCLSIPDLRGLVPRHPAVRVHGLNRDGEAQHFVAEGYEARIIQHEFDHLNGVVFLDRMRDLRSLAFSAEWEEFMTSPAEQPAPVG